MGRLAFYTAGTLAAIAVFVWALVKMGAPGWFGLTFALALAGVTIALFWGWLLAGLVAFALVRFGLWRARRGSRGMLP